MIRPVRLLRQLGFARGPLRRRSDRAQKTLFAATVLMAGLAIPVAADAAGSATDGRSGELQQTYAVLAQDVPAPISYGEYGTVGSTKVKASWQAPDGSPRSGEVEIRGGGSAGQRVPVWTDVNGTPVDDTARLTQWFVRVVLKPALTVLAWLAGVLVVHLLVGWLLWKHRISLWGKEWERAERAWRQAG